MKEPKHDDQPEEHARRLPYVAPAVEETAEFETLALTCTQLDGNLACLGGYTLS